MSIKTITKENFSAEITVNESPVLVEFWAPWCGYCRRLSPVLDRLSEKLGDALPIAKINVDDEPELEDRFDVSVIPTLYLFQNGAPGDKLAAPNSQAQIEKWINEQLVR